MQEDKNKKEIMDEVKKLTKMSANSTTEIDLNQDFSLDKKKEPSQEDSLNLEKKDIKIPEKEIVFGSFNSKSVNEENLGDQKQLAGRLRKINSVRTYKDFAVRALKDKPTSLAKMIIAEKKKEEIDYNYSPKNSKNIMLTILTAILVIIGVAFTGYVLVTFNQNQIEREQIDTESVILKSVVSFDYKIEVDFDDLSRKDLAKISEVALKETQIPVGEIKIYYFTKDLRGIKTIVDTKDFLRKVDTRLPVQVLGNMGKNFTTGIVSGNDGNHPFMIFEVLDFDTVFSGLLSWEKAMLYDMGDLFGVSSKYYNHRFADLNIYNKDSRVILNKEGNVVFGYTFLDLNTLVFFTNARQVKTILANSLSNKVRE